jgi:hypothetical protein
MERKRYRPMPLMPVSGGCPSCLVVPRTSSSAYTGHQFGYSITMDDRDTYFTGRTDCHNNAPPTTFHPTALHTHSLSSGKRSGRPRNSRLHWVGELFRRVHCPRLGGYSGCLFPVVPLTENGLAMDSFIDSEIMGHFLGSLGASYWHRSRTGKQSYLTQDDGCGSRDSDTLHPRPQRPTPM